MAVARALRCDLVIWHCDAFGMTPAHGKRPLAENTKQ